MKPKLLITGCSGFLGWYLCQLAKETYQVYGTRLNNQCGLSFVKDYRIDLAQSNELLVLLEQLKPDMIIHTAALSKTNICETQPDLSFNINVEATKTLTNFSSEKQIPFAFTSTDLVFNGHHGNYSESDPTDPINVYGKHKLLAEQYIQKTYPSAIIFRIPLLYGISGTANKNFFEEWLEKMKSNDKLALFIDEVRTPVYVACAAKGILNLFLKVNNIIHMGGTECVSRYDFGIQMQQTYGFKKAHITKALQKEITFTAPRPANVTMNSKRAYQLGYQPITVAEGILRCKNRYT